ncbi:MAG: hypothetical protein CVU84_06610 [Firmicutes bacterium HGW-Firmicutes-1]|jgi:hypothetical protein|nr:MAG: hypothetical protein CVU84_06610 [Firmicutes bacterium HGW-Firmicutes-1]
MRQNLVFFIIGFIFIGMLFLGRQPLLARVMSNDEKIITAIKHTLTDNDFCFYGNAKLYVSNQSKAELFQVIIDGAVNGDLKAIEFNINSEQDMNDIVICSYFEDEVASCIVTPIEGFKKILIKKQQPIEKRSIHKEQLIDILNTVHLIEVEKRIPIRINQDTSFAANILTDCYTLTIDPKLIMNELSINNFYYKLENVSVSLFIDEELQIRKIVGSFKIKEVELEIELYLNDFNRDNLILIPDMSDARVIEGSFEDIMNAYLK